MRLIFPGKKHVAHAAFVKGIARAAGAGIEDWDLLVEFADEVFGAGFRSTRALDCPGPGRQIGPATPARGLGIGSDHRNPVLQEVLPAPDLLRISLTNQ